jgi:hypothetical protein
MYFYLNNNSINLKQITILYIAECILFITYIHSLPVFVHYCKTTCKQHILSISSLPKEVLLSVFSSRTIVCNDTYQITHMSFAQAFICIIIVESTIFLSERSVYKLKYSMQMSDLSSVMSMLSNRSRQYCI